MYILLHLFRNEIKFQVFIKFALDNFIQIKNCFINKIN